MRIHVGRGPGTQKPHELMNFGALSRQKTNEFITPWGQPKQRIGGPQIGGPQIGRPQVGGLQIWGPQIGGSQIGGPQPGYRFWTARSFHWVEQYIGPSQTICVRKK